MKNKPYFKAKSISIYNKDIFKLKSIKENSIDLIITSPPYNVDIGYNSHDDEMPYETCGAISPIWQRFFVPLK